MQPRVIERGRVCLVDSRLPDEARRIPVWAALVPLMLRTVLLALPLELGASEPKPHDEVMGGSLWVQICDTSGLDSMALDGLVFEVSRLYAPPAPRILWRVDCSLPPYPWSPQLRVIIMQRLPHAVKLRHRVFRQSAPMAWYGMNQGGSVIHVSRERVAESIGAPKGRLDASHELLPRALGRVVAHELGHHFFGPRHTDHGLMKREFSRYDLVSATAEHLKITREQLEILHAFVQRSFPAEFVVGRKMAEPPP